MIRIRIPKYRIKVSKLKALSNIIQKNRSELLPNKQKFGAISPFYGSTIIIHEMMIKNHGEFKSSSGISLILFLVDLNINEQTTMSLCLYVMIEKL